MGACALICASVCACVTVRACFWGLNDHTSTLHCVCLCMNIFMCMCVCVCVCVCVYACVCVFVLIFLCFASSTEGAGGRDVRGTQGMPSVYVHVCM